MKKVKRCSICKRLLSGVGRPNRTGLCSACQNIKYRKEHRK